MSFHGTTILIKTHYLYLFWIFLFLHCHDKHFVEAKCKPKDCIVSPWSLWSECSETCGEDGFRLRSRTTIQHAECGGSCPTHMHESEVCNHKCCPEDCALSSWGRWKDCTCKHRSEFGAKIFCIRERTKSKPEKCGGFCSNKLTESKYSRLCCFKNCVETEWNEWSRCIGQCEQKGIQHREKVTIIEGRCGGRPCTQDPEERECIVDCCPEDCQLGEWSEWSVCSTTCGQGQTTRKRSVRQGKCGGHICPLNAESETKNCTRYVDVSCVVSPWSAWETCKPNNGECAAGKRNRTRHVVVDVGCHGTICPPLWDMSNCEGPCCRQDCVFTDWTEWSSCSTKCGKGISNRTREITKQPSCNGTECPTALETRPCMVNETINCELSEWSDWAECDNACGKGEQYRTRRHLTPAYCGGEKCQQVPLIEKQECESYRAKQDCVLSEWGEWGECFHNCEEGHQHRLRTRLKAPACNGTPCEAQSQFQTCHAKCYEDQNCNQGVCSCAEGYVMAGKKNQCFAISCGFPKPTYCPSSYKAYFNCKYPEYTCDSHNFNTTCTASCKNYPGWVLKGSPTVITCRANRKWSQAEVFCAPPNHPPTAIEVEKTRIPDDSPAGYIVTYLSTEDIDELDEHHYEIVEDSTDRLTIDRNKVVLKTEVDFEIPPVRWNVTIRTSDLDNQTLSETFEFEIEDKNDPPSSATLDPDTIPENSDAGTFVGCLNGTDEEDGGNLTFVLVNSDFETFSSFTNTERKTCIELSRKSDMRCGEFGGDFCVLNEERQRHHFITVMVTDYGTPPESSYFDLRITLGDENDRPSDINLIPRNVPEGIAAGEPIAQLKTRDEDSKQTHTYKILNNAGGLFSLVDGKKIAANRTFDFETEGSQQFEIVVKSTDNGDPPLSLKTTIKFKIQDVNEAPYDLQITSSNAPMFFEPNKPKIRENAKDVTLGTVTVKDYDKDDHVKLSLPPDVSDRLSVGQEECSSVGNVNVFCTAKVVCTGLFDFETEQFVNVTVTAEDIDGLETSINVTLEVIDMNDTPEDILVDGNSTTEVEVPESKNNFEICSLSVEDQDKEDNHTFYLIDSSGGKFVLNNNVLKTSSSANLDFEATKQYTITIAVEDDGNPPLSMNKSFTVKVMDVNEAPTNITLSNNKIPENSQEGDTVGQFVVTDPDNSVNVTQTFSFVLVNSGAERFTMDGDTLKVVQSTVKCGEDLCNLNYEMEKEIKIVMNITDNGTPPMHKQQEFSIILQDVNDPPKDVDLVGEMVSENALPGVIIGELIATEEDEGQRVTFTLGDHKDKFDIKNMTSLVTKVKLNYEEESSYNVTISCVDSGDPPASTETVVTVHVVDMNEAPVYSGETTFDVQEDIAVSSSIGVLKATDPDSSDNLQITLADTHNYFTLSDISCQNKVSSGTECSVNLTVAMELDYEKHSQFNISVTVLDKEGLSVAQIVTVIVQNTNDPPQDILLNGMSMTSVTLKENTQVLSLGTLSAKDPDTEQSHTFKLLTDADGYFVVNDTNNQLQVAPNVRFDYEEKQTYSLSIQATDSGTPALSYNKTCTVNIENVNEIPANLTLTNSQIEENSDEGTVVGKFKVDDPDNVKVISQTFTFVLTDNAEGRFKVVGDELQVARSNADCLLIGGKTCSLNFETAASHTVKVLVTDSGVPSQSQEFSLTIEITDVNDPPINMNISNFKINSTAPGGTEVGRLSVSDEDVGQNHTFLLEDDSNGLFFVTDNGSLTKMKDNILDVNQLYMVKVMVTDNGQPPKQAQETFSITVVEDDNITVTFTSHGSPIPFDVNKPVVAEDSPVGTVIGTLVADESVPDQHLEFEIQTSNGDWDAVTLDASPECQTQNKISNCSVKVLTGRKLDYETTASLTLIVHVTGKAGKTKSEIFTLQIQDVNEPPLDLEYQGKNLTVLENENGKIMGLFTAYDQDDGDTLKYELVDNGGGKFMLSEGGQLSTSSDANLNYEEVQKINITVRVTDAAGLSMEQEYTVTVLDVNEPPSNITLTNNTVKEVAGKDTVIGTLLTADPDQGQTISYTLLNDADGRFYIDNNIIKVKDIGKDCDITGGTNCLLDFEISKSHGIVVKATDNGTPSLSATSDIVIEVQDVNEAPTDLVMTSKPTPEDLEVGEVIGTLQAQDEDLGQKISYSVTAGDPEELFNVEENQVKLVKPLNYEDKAYHTLTIQAEDTGSPPLKVSRQFNISVLDVNETPFGLAMEPKTGITENFEENQPLIAENRNRSTLIGQLVVHDPDMKDTVKLYTTNPEIALFNQQCMSLTKGTRCTCDVRSNVRFDFETTPSVELSLEARDSQGLPVRISIDLKIRDENDPPTDIILNNGTNTSLSIPEGTRDITLTSLTTVDADSGQTHTYSLLTSTKVFYITGQQLKVTSTAELDFESQQLYELQLRSIDSGRPPLHTDKTVTVSVTDVNEDPSTFTLSRNQIPENCEDGYEIGTLETTDPDNSVVQQQTFVYELTDSADELFMLDGPVLKVKKSDFDFETKNAYMIEVKVTDSGSPPLSIEDKVTLEITDSNDPPQDLTFSGSTVKENSPVGTVVGELSADDADNGQTLSYSLTSDEHFTVVDNKVLVNGPLDFEDSPSLTIEVTVQDSGFPPLSLSENFTIHVTDENESPSNLTFAPSDAVQSMTMPEHTKIGEVIGHLEAWDPDHSDTLLIELQSDAGGYFGLSAPASCETVEVITGKRNISVIRCTAHVILQKVLNYEDNVDTRFTLMVKASDQAGDFITQNWSLGVANSNEPPRNITIDGAITTIPENMDNFTIGALQTEDEDKADNHTYQILSHWETFAINQSNRLTVIAKLDYEKKNTYTVKIRSKDTGTPSLSYDKEFTFTVTNVNEQPTKIELSHSEVSNVAAVGDVVGYVVVKDPDNEGQDPPTQNHTCTVGGDGLGVFRINTTDTGALAMKVMKPIPKGRNSIMTEITCTDSGSPPLSLSVDYELSINETFTVPKDILLKDQRTVPENLPADFDVGTLFVVSMLSFEEVNGTFDFSLNDTSLPFKIVGNKLKTLEPLDYEDKFDWEVTVIASGTDSRGNTVKVKKTLTVEVSDVNEHPTEVNIYGSGEVRENSEQGTPIGDLNTVDTEKYQNFTYEIMAVSAGLDIANASDDLMDVFQLSGRNLQVGPLTSAIDYEYSRYFTLLIQTTDSGSPPLSLNGTVHITLKDVNDAPTRISLNNSLVTENNAVDTVVGELSVTDEDVNQTHTCEVQNSREVPFKVINKLYLAVSRDELDFEKLRMYIVQIECSDEGEDGSSLSLSSTFTINVTNVNEPPYDIKMSDSEIKENNMIGQSVGEILAVDPDNDQVTFSIVGESVFAIEGDSTLTATSVLDYETQNEYEVTVIAEDATGLSSQEIFTIKVLNVNEAPKSVKIDHLTVKENSLPGEIIGTLTTVDDDGGQKFVYTIVEKEGDNGLFAIEEDKLVTGATPLDFETNSEHHILINSTDDGNPPASTQEEFVIIVEDINEPPEDIIIGKLSTVKEDTAMKTVLTTIQVDDPDTMSHHVCHVAYPLSVLTNDNKEMSLVLIGHIDYEKQSIYSLELSCSDGQSDIKKAINLTIEDVNEAPTFIKLSGSGTIIATAEPGHVIGNLSVVDPDHNQKHVFTLSGPNSDILKVNNNSQLFLSKPIPEEQLSNTSPYLGINITASDNGIPSLSTNATFKLPITDIPVMVHNLPVITLGNKEIKEDMLAGEIIGLLYNVNLTVHEDIRFELVKNPDSLFNIRDNKYLVLAKNLTEIEGMSRIITVSVRNVETFQTSQKSITIFIMKIDKCRVGLTNKTCDDNARCVDVNKTFFVCQCDSGFTGDGYTCENINDCVLTNEDTGKTMPGNPCKNKGVCIDEVNGYDCECKPGFSGPNCEVFDVIPDPCSSDPCLNSGSCIPSHNDDGRFTCVCLQGWTGEICDINIDDCVDAICNGGGSCVDKIETYVCDCTDDRHGPKCEYLKSVCQQPSICDVSNEEICVPLANRNMSVCALYPEDVVELKVPNIHMYKSFDEDEFTSRIVDRVRLFCNRGGNQQANGRKRRSVDNDILTSQSLEDRDEIVQVYVVDVKESEDDFIDTEFVVIDTNDTPYTKQEVMDMLVNTCLELEVNSNADEEICPAVLMTLTQDKPDNDDEEQGTPVAVIVGILGGVVVLLIVVALIVIILRKKHQAEKDDLENYGNSSIMKGMETEGTSRRSSGYASFSKQTPGTPQIDKSVNSLPQSSNTDMHTDLDTEISAM